MLCMLEEFDARVCTKGEIDCASVCVGVPRMKPQASVVRVRVTVTSSD